MWLPFCELPAPVPSGRHAAHLGQSGPLPRWEPEPIRRRPHGNLARPPAFSPNAQLPLDEPVRLARALMHGTHLRRSATAAAQRVMRRAGLGAALLLAALAVAACGVTPQTVLEPTTEAARASHWLFLVVFWAGLAVFIVVEGMLLYTIVRFRRRRGDTLPPQTHGNLKLEIGWTIAPTVLVVLLAALTVPVIFANAQEPEDDALRVEAIGHQWWFEFNYPDIGVVTANELHLPVGKPAAIIVKSEDVLHSFWVPALRGKIDMVPGRTSVVRILPEQTGTFPGQCAEFCGTAHALMRFTVVVEEAAAFDAWAAHQLTDRVPPTTELAQAGEALLTPAGCTLCHTIRGVSEIGTIGPDLTHIGSRGHIAANMMDMSLANLEHWLRDPEGMKPGNLMNLPRELTEDEIEALTEYLMGLK